MWRPPYPRGRRRRDGGLEESRTMATSSAVHFADLQDLVTPAVRERALILAWLLVSRDGSQ